MTESFILPLLFIKVGSERSAALFAKGYTLVRQTSSDSAARVLMVTGASGPLQANAS